MSILILYIEYKFSRWFVSALNNDKNWAVRYNETFVISGVRYVRPPMYLKKGIYTISKWKGKYNKRSIISCCNKTISIYFQFPSKSVFRKIYIFLIIDE